MTSLIAWVLRAKSTRLYRLGCVTAIALVSLWHFIIVPLVYSRPLPLRHNYRTYPDPLTVDTRFMQRFTKLPNTDNNITQTDPNTCANSSTSFVRLHSQKAEYILGETVLVEIHLFDSYLQRKTRGGDIVRVWMKDYDKSASTAGLIIDHDNGTYTGSLKTLWTGSPQIEVSIAGCREMVEVFHRIYRDHYSLLNYFSALFQNGDVEEQTECLPVPQIPGYTRVCNLTSENYGLPWYCGKPSQSQLLCQDVTGLSQYGGHMSHVTSQEAKFFESRRLHQKIPGPLHIKVYSDKNYIPSPIIPCNKLPLRRSWEASTPVGFFYNNQWKSLTCNNTIPPDPDIYRKCLRDRTLWLHGDSTSRQWFKNFQRRLDLLLVTEKWHRYKWYKPSVLRNELWNFTIMLIFHEYPFYHGGSTSKLAYNRATHSYLDELPSVSRDIFVIHLYLHFQPYPPEVYRIHIRRIAKSVRSLVARAPGVKLAIRGPHAFVGGKITLGYLDDCWVFVYDSIIREEFRGLEGKVLFLNNVDLTIATENFDAHPNDLTVDSLLEQFMGHVCDI